jgi:integrase
MSQSKSNRFLIEAALAPTTLAKYKYGVRLFIEWCSLHNYDVSTIESFDELLSEYFHDLYEQNDGTGKGLAAQTLYGIIKFLPRLHDRLPTATMSLKGWLKLQPGKSFPPLTWDLTVLISCQLCRQHKLLRYAIATLLAFDCFLRVGELVNIRRSDVATSGDSRMGSEYNGTAIRLRKTKTGPNQWVSVQDKSVETLLLALVSTVSSDQSLLFPFTANQYRSRFKDVCRQLALSSAYVPHSLRHGGATRWHLLGHSIEDILLRGRWSSTKSARRYIQAGRAMLLSIDIPKSLASKAQLLSQHIILSLYLSLSLSQ